MNVMAGSVWEVCVRLDFQVFSAEQLLPKCSAPEHQAVRQHCVLVGRVQWSALAGTGSLLGVVAGAVE